MTVAPRFGEVVSRIKPCDVPFETAANRRLPRDCNGGASKSFDCPSDVLRSPFVIVVQERQHIASCMPDAEVASGGGPAIDARSYHHHPLVVRNDRLR